MKEENLKMKIIQFYTDIYQNERAEFVIGTVCVSALCDCKAKTQSSLTNGSLFLCLPIDNEIIHFLRLIWIWHFVETTFYADDGKEKNP